jgi:phosphocarrier protein
MANGNEVVTEQSNLEFLREVKLAPMFFCPEPEIRRVTRQLTLLNEHGLRALPATELARCASGFKSTIIIKSNGKQYRADQIMEVLLARLNRGDTFMIEATGTDAIQAVDCIARLIVFLKEAEEEAKKCRNPHGEIVD